MSDNLEFECPHCRQTVAVTRDALGGMTRCPHCEGEFQARAPVGRFVGEAAANQPNPETGRNGEEQTLRKLHPVMFRNHLLLSLLCFVLIVGGVAALLFALMGRALLGIEGTVLAVVGAAALLVAVGFIVRQWLYAIATRVTVTSSRIIVTRGIVTKRTNELQHDDVRNIRCDQNVLERLFNYGDIALSSSGQDDMEIVIHDVPDPQALVEIVRRHQ